MDLLASQPKQRRKYCLLAFHYYGLNKMLTASNEHCSIAHYTFYRAPYITQRLLSNDLCNYYSVDHDSLHLPCYNAIIKNVIKSISLYWACVALLILPKLIASISILILVSVLVHQYEW